MIISIYLSILLTTGRSKTVSGRHNTSSVCFYPSSDALVPGDKQIACGAATTPAPDPHDLLTFCEASRKGRSSTAWARKQRCPSAIGKPRRSWARGCLERCSWARMRVAGRLGVGAVGAIGAVGAVGAVAGGGNGCHKVP
jgi:hypothetical protein